MSNIVAHHSSTWAEQAERDRSRQESSHSRMKARQLVRELQNPLSIGGLLVLAALSHGGVFGDASGYVASVGGVVVGAGVAAFSARWHLGYFHTTMLIFAAYLLTGGPLAIPETTTAFVLPSLQTLQMLVLGMMTSWKDLLTVQPPAGSFVGPAIMPFFSSVACAAVAMTIIMRTKSPLWALLPVAFLLLLGILWGSQAVPHALLIGIALGVGSLVWSTWVTRGKQADDDYGTIEFARVSRTSERRTRVGAAVLIAVGAVVAAIVAPLLTAGAHRNVLRDVIEPPLDLQSYHSPISQFRWLSTTAKDTELFTVKELPKGGRIRLATLDQYDGTVFKIAGDTGNTDFRRVGTSFTDGPLDLGDTTNSLHISVADYSDYWIPGGGEIRSLVFSGADKQDLASSLYFSENLGTALSTRRLQPGDEYTVVAVAERSWTDSELEGKAILNVPLPQDSNVPEVIGERAAEMIDGASPGIGQVRAIQQRLHDEGYFSDGSDGLSLPGHRADRLERFLEPGGMIGDDDQYAVMMALMLRSQGIPSRVVMGFYPEKEHAGTITVTGGDTHAWVEVPFEGVGWVAFDPTPPEDQTPRTEHPQPKPSPRPQIVQPPDPPGEPAEVPPEARDDGEDGNEGESGLSATVLLVLQITVVVGLLLLPGLLIVASKTHRSRSRRRTGSEDMRTAGAWDDVVDAASDLGMAVPMAATRREQALSIDKEISSGDEQENPVVETTFHRYDDEMSPILALAMRLDGEVFGGSKLTEESRQRAWDESLVVIKLLREQTPWYRRVWAHVSLRSLRARDRISPQERPTSADRAGGGSDAHGSATKSEGNTRG